MSHNKFLRCVPKIESACNCWNKESGPMQKNFLTPSVFYEITAMLLMKRMFTLKMQIPNSKCGMIIASRILKIKGHSKYTEFSLSTQCIISGDSWNYMPPILVPYFAKCIATQILVIAKLNGTKNFILRGFFCDIICLSKELPAQS